MLSIRHGKKKYYTPSQIYYAGIVVGVPKDFALNCYVMFCTKDEFRLFLHEGDGHEIYDDISDKLEFAGCVPGDINSLEDADDSEDWGSWGWEGGDGDEDGGGE